MLRHSAGNYGNCPAPRGSSERELPEGDFSRDDRVNCPGGMIGVQLFGECPGKILGGFSGRVRGMTVGIIRGKRPPGFLGKMTGEKVSTHIQTAFDRLHY